jgi:hypothetical protein
MSTNPTANVTYILVGHNITRTGKDGVSSTIATFNDGVVTIQPGCEQYRAKITALLKMQTPPIEFRYAEEPPAQVAEASVEPPTVTAAIQASVPTAIAAPAASKLTVEQRKAVNHLRAKEGFDIVEVERPAPPAPRQDAGAGDKTPAYVTWLLRYHPEKFVEVYGVLGMGSIEKVDKSKDPQTGEVRRRRYREPGHVMARRATIYTQKINSSEDLDNGGDE